MSIIHGHRTGQNSLRTKTYNSWRAMKSRCNNKNDKDYPDYGGRGITICKEWSLFINFLLDMGERPIGKTLDRIDVNSLYSKDNCRWLSVAEQNKNKRKSHVRK